MKRSKFSLSNYKLLTMNMGDLVPVGLQEVLPGDTFQHSTNALLRVAPQLAPVMHPVRVRIHHWFVPTRILWEDFEDFITGGPYGSTPPVFPTITTPAGAGFPVGSLADFFGINTGVGSVEVNALPFRAAALIWNEWYRDQDLQTELTIDYSSGPDTTTSTALQKVAWEKDYFTTARPWPQKGSDITIPLEDDGAVSRVSNANAWNIYNAATDTLSAQKTLGSSAGGALEANDGSAFKSFDPMGGLVVTPGTLQALRERFAILRYEEARAQYGSRFTEYLSYLGVRSSDARLQRPEYLGGGKQTIQFSEVLQTGVTTDGDDTEGVGNLKGHGIGALRSNRYRRFFEEHGYVISFMSVLPKTIYTQGLPRLWNRRTKEDFWQKELQHIGQQAILGKEISMTGVSAFDDSEWGYQDRYDEYRRTESTIAGEFRTSLNYWHMSRMFSAPPALNASFVTADPTDRIYASTATDQLYVMAYHSLQARRLVAQKGGKNYVY